MKFYSLTLLALAGFSIAATAQASFTIPNNTGCGPLCVSPQDQSTGGLSWYWDFGDATTPSTVQYPTHCYTSPGLYTVTLIETFASGADTATGTVTVYPNPVASFTFSAAGSTINFTDQSTGGVVTWYWYFGDSTAGSTLQNPSHAYLYPGTHNVILMVTNSYGCSDSASFSVMTTGLRDLFSPANAWSLFPNPSQGRITIQFDETLDSLLELRVENMPGEVILSEKISGDRVIDLSAFSPGIYFVRVGEGPARKVVIE